MSAVARRAKAETTKQSILSLRGEMDCFASFEMTRTTVEVLATVAKSGAEARARVFVATVAHETAGAARIRSSLRPLILERANEMQNFGQLMSRECEVVSIIRHCGAMRSIEPGISGLPDAQLRICGLVLWTIPE